MSASKGRFILGVLVVGVAATLVAIKDSAVPAAPRPALATPTHEPGVVSVVRKTVRNKYGKELGISEITTDRDRMTIRYVVKGVVPIDFSQINANPVFVSEGPTLLVVTVDGKRLYRIDGRTFGETQSSTVNGEEALQWSGGTPHHFEISVVRIMGDTHASFEIGFDL